MRDWPEPDQDTAVDILETWDIGDYEEARAGRYYEEIGRSEENEEDTPDDGNPYADWEPNTCHCGNTNGCYCQSMENDARGAQEDDFFQYINEKEGEAWEKFYIAKLNANAAKARSDILQAKANIARIKANIAVFKSEIAYNNYLSNLYGPVDDTQYYTDAENQLVNAEADLVEAKTVLANARTRGAAHASVIEAENYVKYAEAKVQIKKDAKNSTIEFVETFNSKFVDDESESLVENDHIEFVNALIELAEAKDALDLAKTLLAKTPLEITMDTINVYAALYTALQYNTWR